VKFLGDRLLIIIIHPNERNGLRLGSSNKLSCIMIHHMWRANTHVCRTCGSRFQLVKIHPSQDEAGYCPYFGQASVEPH
jgi:hypothetical protein